VRSSHGQEEEFSGAVNIRGLSCRDATDVAFGGASEAQIDAAQHHAR